MRKNINLLPPQLQQQRHRRFVFYVLAVVQVIIFLVLGGVFLHMRGAENRLHARSYALTAQIAALVLPENNAENSQNETVAELAETAWLYIVNALPSGFDPAWLEVILDTVPQWNLLLSLDFNGAIIMLTALAESFDAVSKHQQALVAVGLFEAVQLGATQRTDDGLTRFTLRLIPSEISDEANE